MHTSDHSLTPHHRYKTFAEKKLARGNFGSVFHIYIHRRNYPHENMPAKNTLEHNIYSY